MGPFGVPCSVKSTNTSATRRFSGELEGVEGLHDFDSIRQLLDDGCWDAGESVHSDDVDSIEASPSVGPSTIV